MNEIKFIHCADFHLGSPMSGIGEYANVRRDELLNSFGAVVDLCIDEEAQLLLIAGDLFDRPSVSDEVCRYVENQLSRLSIPVFISLGNHDYRAVGGAYDNMDLKSNVYIFDGSFSSVELSDLGVRVFGAGFGGEYCDSALVSDFGVLDDDKINLVVLHGDVVSSGSSSRYNPIDVSKFAGADYCAFGHIHKRTTPSKIGSVTYAYSGSVESRGFDETGEKGVYIGTVSKGKCSLEFKRICKRIYHDIAVDVSECDTADSIYEAVQNAIVGDKQRDLYKLTLTGKIPADVIISSDVIKNRLDGIFFVKIRNKTGLRLDYDLVRKEYSLRGFFLDEMLRAKERCLLEGDTTGAEKYDAAIEYGMRAFEGEVSVDEN
ncbi:MAG: DNA repair exonuclease [Clostridia bacterium]|nr:DNA repair exonuclease [Clostridia bacterium]